MTEEPALDLRDLGSALWASQAWIVALIGPDGRIASASPRLEAVSGRALVGQPAASLVSATQAQALGDAIRTPGPHWTELHLALVQQGDDQQTDYLIRVRATAGGTLLVGEPDVLDLKTISDQMAAVTEDMIRDQRRMSIDNDRLDRLATTDPLTKLGNRRQLQTDLGALLDGASDGSVLSVVFADIDHFKSINDALGHAVGDRVLADVAARLGQVSRTRDLVSRYGGEEFVAVLPGTNLAGAARWAERARAALADPILPELGRAVTASFGVAQHRLGESADDVIARADGAMYLAKTTGRDRVALAPDAATEPLDGTTGQAPFDPISVRREPTAGAGPAGRLSDVLWISAGIGVAEFDANDRLLGANAAFDRLVGGSKIGSSLAEIVATGQHDAIATFVAAAGADWSRGDFGVVHHPDDVPADRVLWIRRGATGLELIIDSDPELPERTTAPLLGLVDDLVAAHRTLTRTNESLRKALDDLQTSKAEVRRLRDLVPLGSSR